MITGYNKKYMYIITRSYFCTFNDECSFFFDSNRKALESSYSVLERILSAWKLVCKPRNITVKLCNFVVPCHLIKCLIRLC